jgi:surface antigen
MRSAFLALILLANPVHALNEGLQCVPYARALTGVEIRGDAHTWWRQAEGRYQRGSRPKVGAVMAFIPHGNMRLGHVAAVRKVIDNRTVLISHANWSTIDGVRGHIEEDVRAIDVSEDNDWSRVRVWYTPNEALGGTEWPLHGFIYPAKARSWSEGNKAVASLLGHVPNATNNQVPWATGAKPNVKPVTKIAAVSKPKTAFSLSPKLLAEIEQRAAKEAKRVWIKPQTKTGRADPIAGTMAQLSVDKRH